MHHKPTNAQIIAFLQNGNDKAGFSFQQDGEFDGTKGIPGIILLNNYSGYKDFTESGQKFTELLSLLSDKSFKGTIYSDTQSAEYKDATGTTILHYKKVNIGDFWQSQGINEFLLLCTKDVLDKMLKMVEDKQKATTQSAVCALQ